MTGHRGGILGHRGERGPFVKLGKILEDGFSILSIW